MRSFLYLAAAIAMLAACNSRPGNQQMMADSLSTDTAAKRYFTTS